MTTKVCRRCPEKGEQPIENFRVRKYHDREEVRYSRLGTCRKCEVRLWGPVHKPVEIDRRKHWPAHRKTVEGIREKLLAAGLVSGSPEYKRAYAREWARKNPEARRDAFYKFYHSKPAEYHRERNRRRNRKWRAKQKEKQSAESCSDLSG